MAKRIVFGTLAAEGPLHIGSGTASRMVRLPIDALISDPGFQSFLISYAAAVGWDLTKRGLASLRAKIQADSTAPDRQQAQAGPATLVRECQRAVCQALRLSEQDLAEKVFANSEYLVDTIADFIRSGSQHQTLLQALRGAAARSGHGTLNDAEIEALAASALLALSQSPISSSLILRNQESMQGALREISQQLIGFEGSIDTLQQCAQFSRSVLPSAADAPARVEVSSLLSALNRRKVPDGVDEVQIQAAFQPPQTPVYGVPRERVADEIAQRLRSDPVLAVHGYPNGGKTLAVADFARRQGARVFWFTCRAMRASGISDQELLLLCVNLFLQRDLSGLVSISQTCDIVAASCRQQELLIVIDDAHFMDFPQIKFLVDASRSIGGRLRVILIHSDDPRSTPRLRLSGVPTYRLPGMRLPEAADLFSRMGIAVNQRKLAGIRLLCARFDGHVGALVNSTQVIRRLSKESDLLPLLGAIPPTSTGAQFLDALAAYFMRQLSRDCQELCSRLAICTIPFGRDVAQALWTTDLPPAGFASAWRECVAGAFDHVGPRRYDIPHLYKTALTNQQTPDHVRNWRFTLARQLTAPLQRTVDPRDIVEGVLQYILASDFAGAVESAARFLGIALGTDAPIAVVRYLSTSFSTILDGPGFTDRSGARIRAQYYTAQVMAGRATKQEPLAEMACERLATLASDAALSHEEKASGWLAILAHRTTTGDVNRVFPALDELVSVLHDADVPYVDEFLQEGLPTSVMCAIAMCEEAPLPHIRTLVDYAKRDVVQKSGLWTGDISFAAWQGMLLAVRRSEARGEMSGVANELIALAEELCSIGVVEPAILCLSEAIIARIDVDRDIPGAMSLLREYTEYAKTASHAGTRAVWHTAAGDALRCGKVYRDAVKSYARGVRFWEQTRMAPELAVCLHKLGISHALLGDYGSAMANIRKSIRLLARGHLTSGMTLLGEHYIEYSLAALRAGELRASLASMTMSYRIFEELRSTRGLAVVASLGLQLSGIDDAQSPGPGVTFGLPLNIPGANEMKPSAAPIGLALMAAKFGFLRRAHAFFKKAYDLCEADDPTRSATAGLAFVSLFQADVHDLVFWASRVASLPPPSIGLGAQGPWDPGKVADAVLPRVMRVVQSEQAVALIEGLQGAWESNRAGSPCADYEIVRSCLDGLCRALKDGNCAELGTAFSMCLGANAFEAARNLAWFRGLVFLRGRQDSAHNILRWHWRLCWLTIRCSRDSPEMAAHTMELFRGFWRSAVDHDSKQPAHEELRRRVNDPDLRLSQFMAVVLDTLKAVTGFSLLCPEVILCLEGDVSTATTREVIIGTALDLLLMPVEDETKEPVATEVRKLCEAAEHLDGGPERHAWMEELDALEQIWGIVHDQWGVAPVQAVLRLRGYLSRLSAASAASFLLLLWQSSQGALLRDSEESRLLYSVLSGSSIGEFIQDHPGLLESTILRLRLAGADTDVFWNVGLMTRAQFVRHLQGQMGSPVTRQAHRQVEQAISETKAAAERTDATFQQVEVDARALGDLPTAAICCHYWGRAYYQIAASPWNLLAGAEPDKGLLDKALVYLRRAYDTAVAASDHDQAVASACQAAFVAHDRADEDVYQEFLMKAQDHAAQSGDPRHGMILEDVRERRSLIRGRGDYVRRQSVDDFVELDDESIQRMAQDYVQAMGIPEHRIDNVVDDLKKINAINREKRTFCEHFLGFQNLGHMSSPQTAYSRRTRYVGRCDLFGHETRIELEDIETVIKAFQEVHCKDCAKRQPGVGSSLD